MITLSIHPGKVITRDDFVLTHPPYSIALDGYVFGEPFLDVSGHRGQGPYRSFNHHEEVDRSCMSATCEQVRRGVLLGLYDLFRNDGQREATLYVNDCDQDVCLASWILMNPDRAAEPMVRMLSQIEDLLDTSAGTFPMPHECDLLGQVRWVFQPYVHARPRIASLNAGEMLCVIEDVHRRIGDFVIGRAKAVPLSGSFKRIGGGAGWSFVEIIGGQARERLLADGVQAAIELYGRPQSDRFSYSIWRRSEYIASFPVPLILAALNEAEGLSGVGGWGGALTCGGSPRGVGSSLSPEHVERVVREVCEGMGGSR